MSKLSEIKQTQSQGVKQITDEQINECMQFCAMYNILHSIHNFKIELKNVDEKKKVKTKSKLSEGTIKGTSSITKNKQENKKVSKFQKPKVSKKKQIQKSVINQQPQSEVDNYNYQQQIFTTSRLYQQPMKDEPKLVEKENNLNMLISKLATNNNESNPKTHSKEQDSSFSAFFMKSPNQQQQFQSSAYQKSQYNSKYNGIQEYQTQNLSSYLKNNTYMNSSIPSTNNTQSQYLSNYESFSMKNQSFNQSQNNPYSKASYQGINYDLSHFSHHPITHNCSLQYTNYPSPYTSQFNPNMNSNQNEISYLSKNNFYQQSQQPLLLSTSKQNLDSNLKYQVKPYQSQLTQKTKYVGQSQYNPIQNVPSHFNHMELNQQKQQNFGTPTKNLTPKSSNRSLSPLGASGSCRNFFMKSPRDVSADNRSETSRSKSRRNQRPGGSKSFYQPSLSGRKIVSKKRQTQIPPQQHVNIVNSYNPNHQIQNSHHNDEYEVPYFKQQQQEQAVSYYQKKPNRMTRQTEISLVSGWQQRSHPQKTTKSQQIINSQQYDNKNSEKGYQIHKTSHQNKQVKKNKHSRKSSSEHSSSQSQQVQLDNIQVQMQELSSSRKKIPVPIKIDMTKKENEPKKIKR